ncbi:MAG: hypothetical protein R6V27_14680 [Balneolaceae bacterium]
MTGKANQPKEICTRRVVVQDGGGTEMPCLVGSSMLLLHSLKNSISPITITCTIRQESVVVSKTRWKNRWVSFLTT